jgi:hypothetical protein
MKRNYISTSTNKHVCIYAEVRTNPDYIAMQYLKRLLKEQADELFKEHSK